MRLILSSTKVGNYVNSLFEFWGLNNKLPRLWKLSIHQLFGFLSPSARQFCRLCMVSREELSNGSLGPFMPRTKEIHKEHVKNGSENPAMSTFVELERKVFYMSLVNSIALKILSLIYCMICGRVCIQWYLSSYFTACSPIPCIIQIYILSIVEWIYFNADVLKSKTSYLPISLWIHFQIKNSTRYTKKECRRGY